MRDPLQSAEVARRLPHRVVSSVSTAVALVLAGFGVFGVGVFGVGASSAAATAPPRVTSRAQTTGSGCGTRVASGSVTLTIQVAHHARTVIVHVPRGYTGARTVPLVLNLHGSGSTAAAQEYFSGMDTTADRAGFVVAYPQALIPDGVGYDWNVPGEPLVTGAAVPASAANDVAFLTDLVARLESRYCIDSKKVYATGFSGGARMASQLACDAASTFAAVAPVSGLRRPTPCPARRAVPVIAFHGTADPVDPYAGHGLPYWTYSVTDAARYWSEQDSCSDRAVTSAPDRGVTLTRYSSCKDGAVVELYTIAGEGHEWPGGPPLPKRYIRLLGSQSSAIDADTTMWAFFAAHPMR